MSFEVMHFIGTAEVQFFYNKQLKTANIYMLDADTDFQIKQRVINLLYKINRHRRNHEEIFITDKIYNSKII